MTDVRVMGILNLNADSFSDHGAPRSDDEHREAARRMLAAGADVLDVGAQSATTDTPVTPVPEEIARITALLAGLPRGTPVSVDTYKAPVAAAALDAGATIINDYSGDLTSDLVDVVADRGARYVLTHNEGVPKERLTDPARYDDVVARVVDFFATGLAELDRRGVPPDDVVLDPGVDLSKTPAQTIDLLRRIGEVAVAFPSSDLLLAVSRKDFVGALTRRHPAERDPGTLAALAWCTGELAEHPGSVFLRVHDVRAVTDLLRVLGVLRGREDVAADLELPRSLFRNPSASPGA